MQGKPDPMWEKEHLIGILEIRWRKDGKIRISSTADPTMARKMLEEGMAILNKKSKGENRIIVPFDSGKSVM